MFPVAFQFWENAVALSHIETKKPQRQDNLTPSLDGAKKYFLQSVLSTICILYNTINNLMPREIYFFWLVTSGNEMDMSIFLKKSFLPKFIDRNDWLFERNVSENKVHTPPREYNFLTSEITTSIYCYFSNFRYKI